MTRPRARMLLAVAALALVLIVTPRLPRPAAHALFALLVLVWLASVTLGRGFFRGRALQRRRAYRDAIAAYEAFLASPWPRYLRFLWVGLYTSDPAALAENNVGACLLNLGELDAAEVRLRRAVERDAGYAIPWVNLGLVATLRGDVARGREHFARAAALGYSSAALDAAARAALARHNVAVGERV